MDTSTLITLVTILVTWILGAISKKSEWMSNNLIPLQNALIGLIVALIEFAITKDYKVAIAISGILAGGSYDIFHNLEKIFKKGE